MAIKRIKLVTSFMYLSSAVVFQTNFIEIIELRTQLLNYMKNLIFISNLAYLTPVVRTIHNYMTVYNK